MWGWEKDILSKGGNALSKLLGRMSDQISKNVSTNEYIQ